jgi:4'-phosphopantetheinyl transferase
MPECSNVAAGGRRRPRCSLGSSEARVWYVFPDAVTDPGLLRAYQALLSAEETARQRRFRFDKLRHDYAIGCALLRTTLSRYADVDPAAWSFVKGAYGRPEIANPKSIPMLRFNLSHTEGLIACVVVLERDVGIDVEDTGRHGDVLELADRFFSSKEVAALHALSQAAQKRRFFEYWTLKEAYLKARGTGLSVPLNQFSFRLEGPAVRICFDSPLGDDVSKWQFALFRPTARHQLAVGIRREREDDLHIRLAQTIPLLTDGIGLARRRANAPRRTRLRNGNRRRL